MSLDLGVPSKPGTEERVLTGALAKRTSDPGTGGGVTAPSASQPGGDGRCPLHDAGAGTPWDSSLLQASLPAPREPRRRAEPGPGPAVHPRPALGSPNPTELPRRVQGLLQLDKLCPPRPQFPRVKKGQARPEEAFIQGPSGRGDTRGSPPPLPPNTCCADTRGRLRTRREALSTPGSGHVLDDHDGARGGHGLRGHAWPPPSCPHLPCLAQTPTRNATPLRGDPGPSQAPSAPLPPQPGPTCQPPAVPRPPGQAASRKRGQQVQPHSQGGRDVPPRGEPHRPPASRPGVPRPLALQCGRRAGRGSLGRGPGGQRLCQAAGNSPEWPSSPFPGPPGPPPSPRHL